jgi:hypothetical protein
VIQVLAGGEEREFATDAAAESARENKTMSRKSIVLENKWLPYVDLELRLGGLLGLPHEMPAGKQNL